MKYKKKEIMKHCILGFIIFIAAIAAIHHVRQERSLFSYLVVSSYETESCVGTPIGGDFGLINSELCPNVTCDSTLNGSIQGACFQDPRDVIPGDLKDYVIQKTFLDQECRIDAGVGSFQILDVCVAGELNTILFKNGRLGLESSIFENENCTNLIFRSFIPFGQCVQGSIIIPAAEFRVDEIIGQHHHHIIFVIVILVILFIVLALHCPWIKEHVQHWFSKRQCRKEKSK